MITPAFPTSDTSAGPAKNIRFVGISCLQVFYYCSLLRLPMQAIADKNCVMNRGPAGNPIVISGAGLLCQPMLSLIDIFYLMIYNAVFNDIFFVMNSLDFARKVIDPFIHEALLNALQYLVKQRISAIIM